MKISQKLLGITGMLSVLMVLGALAYFGWNHPTFNFSEDYISTLGAKGQPGALGFNLLGFVFPGILLMLFGWGYGLFLKDKLLALLLALFGLGYASTAIPVNLENSETPFSKAHVVAICLGLACWLIGLARLGASKTINPRIKFLANTTALLLGGVLIGAFMNLWSLPLTHRLVFGLVFGWTALTSRALVYSINLYKR